MRLFLLARRARLANAARIGICCLLATIGPRVQGASPDSPDPAIIPWPKQLAVAEGQAPLPPDSRIAILDEALSPLSEVLAGELQRLTGRRPAVVVGDPLPGDIVLALDASLEGDSHRLVVTDRARVTGASPRAVGEGTATLLQVLRMQDGEVSLPRLTVNDGPGLAYCGTLLDLARKPYSLETLRQCVDVCRFYKIRHIQLHLTDENGWVFPSTAYPRLGADNFIFAGGEKPAVYDLEELKRLVAYADARGVTLVPEFEMPGHSGQLRGSLLEIFGWRDADGQTVSPGVINMVRDEAFEALDTIIGEMCDVFQSSPYFHIGCDEASVAAIGELPEARAFMAEHQLASADDVFNAFVNRMHAIVKRHGKRMIVWEGAPFGPTPLPRDVLVMPWVGGSTLAAELTSQGYSVINAPWGTRAAYFDPYAVNGAQLARGEPLLYGATSILWEAPQEAAVPYLRYTGALRNEPTYHPNANRGHADFLLRLQSTDARLDRLLYGFTPGVQGGLSPLAFMRPETAFDEELTLTLETSLADGQARYTLDGSPPTAESPAFSNPITLRQTTTLNARWFRGGQPADLPTLTRTYHKVSAVRHDGRGAKVAFSPEQTGYPGPGPQGLADGLLADGDESVSAGWVGWERGELIRVRLDLGRPTEIRSLGLHCLRACGGIFLPAEATFAVSDDGQAFAPVALVDSASGTRQRGWYVAEIEPRTARYAEVSIRPDGDWTFVDEVTVNGELPAATLAHAARGKPARLAVAPTHPYTAPGLEGLTDGYLARSSDFMNPEWLGIETKNLEATIDLEQPTDLRRVGAHFLQQVRGGIYIPPRMEVFVSDDGQRFRSVATMDHAPDAGVAFHRTLAVELRDVRARYVKLIARSGGPWLFVDEVFVNPGE